jgi:hypothetical protein
VFFLIVEFILFSFAELITFVTTGGWVGGCVEYIGRGMGGWIGG